MAKIEIYLMAAIAGLAFLALVAWYSYGKGSEHAFNKCQLAKQEAVEHAIAQMELLRQQDAEIATGFEEDLIQIRRHNNSLREQVRLYVQKRHNDNVCFDADGLRLWNAASRGQTTASADEPKDKVSDEPK